MRQPIASSPQPTADHVRDGMWRRDRASRALGVRIVSVTPGRAVLEMDVREDMLNAHDLCHGGLIATLADSAFAYACNSHGELTVAAAFSIELMAPAHRGDWLTATATEASKSGRSGVYDVEVVNAHGKRVALFRGRSHTLRGKPAVPATPR